MKHVIFILHIDFYTVQILIRVFYFRSTKADTRKILYLSNSSFCSFFNFPLSKFVFGIYYKFLTSLCLFIPIKYQQYLLQKYDTEIYKSDCDTYKRYTATSAPNYPTSRNETCNNVIFCCQKVLGK